MKTLEDIKYEMLGFVLTKLLGFVMVSVGLYQLFNIDIMFIFIGVYILMPDHWFQSKK